MLGFIELHNLEGDPYILNMSSIGEVTVNEDGNTVIYPIGQREICYYKVKESYDEVRQNLIGVLT